MIMCLTDELPVSKDSKIISSSFARAVVNCFDFVFRLMESIQKVEWFMYHSLLKTLKVSFDVDIDKWFIIK